MQKTKYLLFEFLLSETPEAIKFYNDVAKNQTKI